MLESLKEKRLWCLKQRYQKQVKNCQIQNKADRNHTKATNASTIDPHSNPSSAQHMRRHAVDVARYTISGMYAKAHRSKIANKQLQTP